MTRVEIAKRWDMPFWELIKHIHHQDFNRKTAAAIIGMQSEHFTALLRANPGHNPWGSPNIIANYTRDTGETFRDVLLRMQRDGYSGRAVNLAIGFKGNGLKYAMRVRGIDIKFKKISAP